LLGAHLRQTSGLGQGLRLARSLLGQPTLGLLLGCQRREPLTFGSLGGLAAALGGNAFGLGALGRQPFFLGSPFGLALRLGVACGLLRREALRLALGFHSGHALTLGPFGSLASPRSCNALFQLARDGLALFFGTAFALALRLGLGFGLARSLLGGLALRLTLGLQGGDALTFGLFVGLALAFGVDALCFGAFGGQAFFFGLQFGLALRLGPRGGFALGLPVDARRIGAAAQDLPADQQAQARSDQQPK